MTPTATEAIISACQKDNGARRERITLILTKLRLDLRAHQPEAHQPSPWEIDGGAAKLEEVCPQLENCLWQESVE
jgi:hypothetical protein